ncbi:MAG: hypothetical protein J7485_05505, partial [Sphingobium sp.]|nr:hypothetical protein [Sphingobium sp.]
LLLQKKKKGHKAPEKFTVMLNLLQHALGGQPQPPGKIDLGAEEGPSSCIEYILKASPRGTARACLEWLTNR